MEIHIERLLTLLRELQRIDSEFPLQYAICLCEIAKAEGLSVTELSSRTGMPISTVSRIVGALSTDRQTGTPFGLVKVQVSPEERRRKKISLTEKGKNAISRLTTTDSSQ